METRLRTGKCFYSTCLSPELHPILPNLINSAPGSSVNFHLIDIFTKSCVSENNLIHCSYSKTSRISFFSLREVGTKKGYDTSLSLNNKQLLNPTPFQTYRQGRCFQKYNILSQYCLKKFYKVLRLFYDFRAFISTLRVYSSWLSSASIWIGEFVHAVPLPWPYAGEHSRPCLPQVHIALAQSDEQLHLIICGCLSVREESNKATG